MSTMSCPFCELPMRKAGDIWICPSADCYEVQERYREFWSEIEAQAAEVAGEEIYFEE